MSDYASSQYVIDEISKKLGIKNTSIADMFGLSLVSVQMIGDNSGNETTVTISNTTGFAYLPIFVFTNTSYVRMTVSGSTFTPHVSTGDSQRANSSLIPLDKNHTYTFTGKWSCVYVYRIGGGIS